MASPVGSILRKVNNPDKKYNILTGCTHPSYETNLCKTGHNFYAFNHPSFVKWTTEFRSIPDNYVIFDKELKDSQIPMDIQFDFVLSQNRFGQFQVLSELARRFHLPLVTLEHTLPAPFWNKDMITNISSMRGDINLFISEYSMKEWGFNKDGSTTVINHGIDTNKFVNKNESRDNVLLSVVNDWANRDYCMPAGQMILTEIGYIPIDKVYVGLKVMTDDGTFRPITKTFERDFAGRMVKIEVSNKQNPQILYLTDSHQIKVHRNGQWKYIDACRVLVDDKLHFPKHIQTDFSCNDLELAWLIGLIIGDGSITTKGNISICIKKDDIELANKTKKILESIIGYASISDRQINKGILLVEATSRIFGCWLKEKIGVKSHNKYIPDFLFYSSDKIRNAVMVGLFTADGCLYEKQNLINFATVSKKLASQYHSIMQSFGIKSVLKKEYRRTNKCKKAEFIYTLITYGKNNFQRMKEFLDGIYKAESYEYIVTKSSIDDDWVGKVYNCEVDTEHSYVIYPGIVAHNCCGFNLWQYIVKDLPVSVYGDNPGLSRVTTSVEELVDIHNKASIFLNTSLVSPVPMSLMEAMSSGMAPISTATCMIPEIIEHGKNGLISNDPEELRRFCIQLLNEPEYARELGDNARKTIEERYSLSAFVDNWNKVFDTAINIVYTGER